MKILLKHLFVIALFLGISPLHASEVADNPKLHKLVECYIYSIKVNATAHHYLAEAKKLGMTNEQFNKIAFNVQNHLVSLYLKEPSSHFLKDDPKAFMRFKALDIYANECINLI